MPQQNKYLIQSLVNHKHAMLPSIGRKVKLGLHPVVYLDSGLVGQAAEEQKMLTLSHTAHGFSYRTDYYL